MCFLCDFLTFSKKFRIFHSSSNECKGLFWIFFRNQEYVLGVHDLSLLHERQKSFQQIFQSPEAQTLSGLSAELSQSLPVSSFSFSENYQLLIINSKPSQRDSLVYSEVSTKMKLNTSDFHFASEGRIKMTSDDFRWTLTGSSISPFIKISLKFFMSFIYLSQNIKVL